MTEQWLPITGFEDSYEVSNDGRARSLDRYRINGKGGQVLWRGREIKPYFQRRSGHVLFNLWRNSRQTKKQAHRLVLEAFVGPAPDGHECCHLDGDPKNNRIENLYWGTRSENTIDSVSHGTHSHARKTHCKQGHPLSGDNLKPNSRGVRICRQCQADSNRKYRARRTAA